MRRLIGAVALFLLQVGGASTPPHVTVVPSHAIELREGIPFLTVSAGGAYYTLEASHDLKDWFPLYRGNAVCHDLRNGWTDKGFFRVQIP